MEPIELDHRRRGSNRLTSCLVKSERFALSFAAAGFFVPTGVYERSRYERKIYRLVLLRHRPLRRRPHRQPSPW